MTTGGWAKSRRLGFWHLASDEPDRIALILSSGARVSYGELLARANQLAHGFKTFGLTPGDTLAMAVPNDDSYYVIHLAAMQSGLYLTPINFHLKSAEVAYILRDSEASLFIADQKFGDMSAGAAREAELSEDRCFAIGSIDGFRSWEALTDGQPTSTPAERHPGAIMGYTSGTTGFPKGVRRPLPSGSPDFVAEQSTIFARAFGLVPLDGTNLVVGPLYHAGPSIFSWGSLHVGHTQVLTNGFDAEQTLQLIERYQVTNTHVVATMFHRLLALPPDTRSRYDVSSLRMVAHSAAPTPVEVKQAMMDWWGPIIWETYGGTEAAATIAKPHHWMAKPGTAGRPVRGVQIEIVDSSGNPCPPQKPGMVYIQKEGELFEYWKDKKKTEESRRGRAFTLGDLGYLDEDGFLFLTGRQADVIISGGVNIYPSEVESALLSHPAVADAVVIGIPNEEWGEEVLAIVQLESGYAEGSETQAVLVDHCKSRIARYKCPRVVHFRKDLPREENGKIYRRRIRDEYWKHANQAI